jgi:hypothetical protein
MSLRDQMPATAEFVDAMRAAFGAEEIDGQIRKGLRGEPTFHAVEAGQEVGTPIAFRHEFEAMPSPTYQRVAR